MKVERKFKIYAALHEESKEGWVWIGLKDIKSDFIKITNLEKGKSVICERRDIDDNFIKLYNKRETTEDIEEEEKENIIVINAYYRGKLGGLETQDEVLLEITETDSIIDKYIKAPSDHPNLFVRASMILGSISIILGFLSFGLGLLSILISIKN